MDVQKILEIFQNRGVKSEHEVVLGRLGFDQLAKGSFAYLLTQVSDRVLQRAAFQQLLYCQVQAFLRIWWAFENKAQGIVLLRALKLMYLSSICLMFHLKMIDIKILIILATLALKGTYHIQRLDSLSRPMLSSPSIGSYLRKLILSGYNFDHR